jgi:hypothetical protein
MMHGCTSLTMVPMLLGMATILTLMLRRVL